MKWTLLLLYGLFQMAISSPVERDSQGNYEGLCTTDECIEVSYRLIKNMNKSADPCEDFYQFACGKFVAEARIPDDKSTWSAFEPQEEEIYLQGKLLLEEEHTENDFKSYKLAKDHYIACINEDKLEELGVEPLLSKLKSFGGWPLLEGNTWDSDSFSWWEWTYKMNEAGFEINNLIDFTINPDDKNTTTRVIIIDQPELGLSREYMIKGFDDKDVQQYYQYMVDIAVLLGAESKQAEKELKDSLLFEIELALITAPKEERRNVSALYNPTTLSEVPTAEGLPPSWTKFAQRMMQLSKSLIITEKEKVILTSQDFLQKLGALISKTDKRTIANYLAWRAAKYSSSILNAEALKIRQRFNKAIKGIQNEPPTWKRCVKVVGFNNYETSNFIYAAASMYVRRYFKPEAKAEMNEMTIYLRQSFENVILKNIDWMNDNVKERAKQKLSLMDQFIAYSDEYLEKDKIDGLYEGLKISQDDFFGNTLRLVVFWRIDQYKKLREKFDPKSWKEHSLIAVVNAFYFGGNNYMEFPAGILQGSFYTYGAPKYINFGAIGTVIGHEITHGFDDKGKQRNQLGEIENWWDPITEETYKKKADCMIDQYSKKISKQVGMNLNGISTQGENIADNGGLKESYHAYLQWVKDNDEEPQLPGLNYTPRQMFWLGFSQLTCTKYHDVALKENILTDSHSPGEFRLNVPLANIEDFARDYNCPLGSKMNPVDKCAVW